DLGDLADPAHLDYVALSGHKLYAPYGVGALVGRADSFARGGPLLAGGGTVRRVTADDIEWADGPARDEAGTPNAVGAVALASACLALADLGLGAIAAREAELTARALARLAAVPRVRLYGDPDPARAEGRLGVIPFAVDGYDPHLVAAILSHEHGIAVRAGSFCAQPYVQRLLGTEVAGCRYSSPGLLRASLGIYTADFEVDLLAEALARIVRRDHAAYELDRYGGYLPCGWDAAPLSLFQLERAPGFGLPAAA
ncbi:MAG: aminotransferase class V-fold PLP-dependent enzyme, partial [Chloroflexales bacterium]|nr:aminotransferase class V-fold PLP-dependent enzyme [Chloroflexales bacterium]